MIDTVNCASGGWFMLAASVLIFGTLVLSSAALIKYLFTGHSQAAV